MQKMYSRKNYIELTNAGFTVSSQSSINVDQSRLV